MMIAELFTEKGVFRLQRKSLRIILGSALITLFTLLGGLAGAFIGGMFWGWAMARLVAPDQSRRMPWAGGLGFGPTFIIVALVLTTLEVILVQRGGTSLPIHIVFTLLFVPASAFIAAADGYALGIALKDWQLAGKLALGAGLTSALAFLVVILLMDTVGYRVGAPGAVERATMVTVLFVGIVASALAGGAVIGWLFYRSGKPDRFKRVLSGFDRIDMVQ
jgi:hypothetical protein